MHCWLQQELSCLQGEPLIMHTGFWVGADEGSETGGVVSVGVGGGMIVRVKGVPLSAKSVAVPA